MAVPGRAGGRLAGDGWPGWARAWRQPFRLWPAGVGAWLGAVVLGMVFRVVSGQGTAPAFVGVALAFLGLFLLGWRLLGRLSWLRQ